LALSPKPPSRDKNQIAGFFQPEEVSAIKRLAATRGMTIRELMARAFNLLFEADRLEHSTEPDPTNGLKLDESASPRGGAAHRHFRRPPSSDR
jgi:hypothetical protein